MMAAIFVDFWGVSRWQSDAVADIQAFAWIDYGIEPWKQTVELWELGYKFDHVMESVQGIGSCWTN